MLLFTISNSISFYQRKENQYDLLSQSTYSHVVKIELGMKEETLPFNTTRPIFTPIQDHKLVP